MLGSTIYSTILLLGIANQPNITVGVDNMSPMSDQYIIPYVGVAGTKDVIVSSKGNTSDTPNCYASVIVWNNASPNTSLSETTTGPPVVLLFALLTQEWKQETS